MSHRCPYCGQRMGCFQRATGPLAQKLGFTLNNPKPAKKKRGTTRRKADRGASQ